MWLLMQIQVISNTFYELTLELSTVLDIFTLKEINLSQDVEEFVVLVRKQSSKSKPSVDSRDDILRREILSVLDRIEKEIVPDHLKLKIIFENLGLCHGSNCKEEIESLQEEIQNQTDEKSKSDIVSLIALVRYGNCVLFGSSSTTTARKSKLNHRLLQSTSDLTNPANFRCPISLGFMRDPDVVATGQTYDRETIIQWIESGHTTCPKTGQVLAHTNLIPNRSLKNLIAMRCREQRISFEVARANLGF